MRIVRNAGYIKSRRRAALTIVAVGLFALFGSWAAYLANTNFFLFAMLGLAFGFLAFNGGMQQMTRWARKPRADQVLDADLKPLSDRYTLIHYPEIPGRRPDHVLVSPSGVLVMTSREVHGKIRVRGTSWRKDRSALLGMFSLGGPQLGNPSIENSQQIESLKDYLAKEEIEIEPEGAIVFIADNVEVDMQDATTPILHASEVVHHVNATAQENTIIGKDREKIIELLSKGDQIEKPADRSSRPKKRVKAR